MERISAKERLKMMLYGNFDGAIPTDDDGLFQLYAAISLIKTITDMVNMMGDYSEQEQRLISYNEKIKYFIKDAEKLMVKYIYEAKDFKGWNKEKLFVQWHHDMLARYQQNAEEWAETIRKKSLYLISIFSLMSITHTDDGE